MQHRLFRATSPPTWANGGSSAHRAQQWCVEIGRWHGCWWHESRQPGARRQHRLDDMELAGNVELGGAQKATSHEPHGARRRHVEGRVGWARRHRGQGGAWRRHREQVGAAAAALRRHASHFEMERPSVRTLRPYHYRIYKERLFIQMALQMMTYIVSLRNTLKVFRGLHDFDALSQVILPQLKLYKTYFIWSGQF